MGRVGDVEKAPLNGIQVDWRRKQFLKGAGDDVEKSPHMEEKCKRKKNQTGKKNLY